MDEELMHFGVLGMHWGHRKSPEEIAKKRDADWEKKSLNRSKAIRVYNAAADRMNAGIISELNNKPKYKGKNLYENKKLFKEYTDEYSRVFSQVLNEESSRVFGTNPSGTKRVKVSYDLFTGHFAYGFEEIQHSDDPIVIVPERDEMGFIISFKVQSANSLSQSELDEGDYLSHFGVLGMKWGHHKGPSDPVGDTARKEAAKTAKQEEKRRVREEKAWANAERLMREAYNKKRIRTSAKVNEMNSEQARAFIKSSPSMQRKIKTYRDQKQFRRIQRAAAITVLAINVAKIYGPSIMKIVKDKRAADAFNKYGGYAAEKVVNSHFV